MGCTYSVPRYVDSSNNKPRLVFIDTSDENINNLPNNSIPVNNNTKIDNKPTKMLKKIYGI